MLGAEEPTTFPAPIRGRAVPRGSRYKASMPTRPPTILALGGGGFLMEPENPLLDAYVVQAAGRAAPRICFLPTASGDRPDAIDAFHDAFGRLGARTNHLLLPWAPDPEGAPEDGRPAGAASPADPVAHLAAQDVVYVGGGNTRRMLAVWRHFGLVAPLRRLWTTGTVVLAGVSAGALCWFEGGVTDSLPGRLTAMRGLGWLPGSFCPHYDGEIGRRPAYEALVVDGSLPAGLAVDDGCAVHFEGDGLVRVVASRPGAAAWRVSADGPIGRSTRVEARYLGPSG